MKTSSMFFLTFILFVITSPQVIFPQPEGDGYLPAAEVMPTPIGGLKGIYKKIEYPEIARKSGIEGKYM